MKRLARSNEILVISLWLLFLAGVVSAQEPQVTDRAADRESIADIVAQWEDAWNEHDMAAFASLFHEDGVWVLWTGSVWQGRGAIEEGHAAVHKTIFRNSTQREQIEDLTFVGPDAAVVRFCSTLIGDARAPESIVRSRKIVIVTRRQGTWRVGWGQNTRLADTVPDSECFVSLRSQLPEARWPAGHEFSDCAGKAWCPTMVVVPAGAFSIGSPSDEPGRSDEEGPQREVRIGRFAVGKYHVTVGQWQAFVRATGRPTEPGCHWTARALGGYDPAGSWEDTGFRQTGERPVVCVTWHDAQAFAAWLREQTGRPYRLLGEAEWEYAARAGSTTAYPWGDTADHERANYGADECCSGLAEGRDRWEYTSPAGTFAANAFGLHDMQGNALQWVEDCFSASYADLPPDGSPYRVDSELSIEGPLEWMSGTRACDYRMLRGGDWGNPPAFIRSANRNWGPPAGSELGSYRSAGVGFRVARELDNGSGGM